MTQKPTTKPANPTFSSGPCAKRPGWSLAALENAFLGRSHRAAEGKARLNEVIERHRALLNIPSDYRVAIVPASDTGALEMAMWSMMGQRPVDVFSWEVFGNEWLIDVTKQLKIESRSFIAPFGELPDVTQANPDHDIVFPWNGTTGGVRVPDADWIASDRKGLTFCDATSAVFAYDMPWDKLDITTWSWQKILGGEAAHGMLVLSPRAVERLLTYDPKRPLPKIFRMTSGGKLIEGLFQGETLNTPSMLAVEDCLDALKWVESLGGVAALQKRITGNFETLSDWVGKTEWIDFLCETPAARSKTSVCLKIIDPSFTAKGEEDRQDFIKKMEKKLNAENAAFDVAAHKLAPAGLRIWCGATVEQSDIAALLPWLDWAYSETKAQ